MSAPIFDADKRLSDEYFGVNRANEEMDTVQQERKKASFPVREMTFFLDQGEVETRYKELANTLISRDPYLMKKRPFDLTSKGDREKTMQQIRRAINVMRSIKDPKLAHHFRRQLSLYDRSYQMRMYVHWMLFRETIWAQGTKEQFAEWEPLIDNMKVVGCFSMTELGHSSFLRGCETYAIYDKQREEFIINSASLLATKWWIGMAGDTATHTVALCNLVIDGEIKGLYWFIVPLRSLVDGQLMPGVTAGFLGPRAGRPGLDNGWIQFTHVRVPRTNMLMKWGQVSADGNYSALANQALSYGSLIGERIFALEEMQAVLSIGSTIAVRYAAVRRQGDRNQQILDYQTHQHALFPIIAFSYALRYMASDLIGSWTGVQMEFEKTGDEKAYMGQIQDYHAVAAGLKAVLGWWTADSLEAIRRTMGGHAYSQYNVINGLIGDFAVVTTGGGDNTILAQQCVRYLIASVKRAKEGKPLGRSVQYLKDVDTDSEKVFRASRSEELRDPALQLHALAWLSSKMVTTAGMTLASLLGSGSDMTDAWNNHLVELVESMRPHALHFVVKTFVAAVDSTRANEKLHAVLSKLCALFGLVCLKQVAQHFLEHGYMSPEQVKLIRQEIVVVCRELRPDAVALVDAFNYPDWIIKAPLGQYDGNIYEAYLATVKEGNPPGYTPYYWREIAPQLHAKM